MIRPSLLQRSEVCSLVPLLANQFPETSDAADRGTAIHAAIARDDRTVPEARTAREWVESNVVGELRFERKVELVDLDTMETLTEGTPDLVAGPDTDDVMVVVDWKTGMPSNVPDPDVNLQLISYGLAICDGRPFRGVLVFLNEDKPADARWSRIFEPLEHPALLERIRAIVHKEPVAHPGDWCGSCYQRVYCPAWKARTEVALTVLRPSTALGARTVTDGNAPELSQRIKAVREAADMAEEQLRAHVRAGGRCIVDGKELYEATCDGRESVDVKAIKAAGLTQYLKAGASYRAWRWRKAKI
jgi:hypothetical protein